MWVVPFNPLFRPMFTPTLFLSLDICKVVFDAPPFSRSTVKNVSYLFSHWVTFLQVSCKSIFWWLLSIFHWVIVSTGFLQGHLFVMAITFSHVPVTPPWFFISHSYSHPLICSTPLLRPWHDSAISTYCGLYWPFFPQLLWGPLFGLFVNYPVPIFIIPSTCS